MTKLDEMPLMEQIMVCCDKQPVPAVLHALVGSVIAICQSQGIAKADVLSSISRHWDQVTAELNSREDDPS